jgi:hypothetical protein
LSELICDTTVVQYLHQLHLLHLLPTLGSPVVLPEAVVAELDQGRAQGIDLPDLSALSWLTVRTAGVRPPLSHAADLGPGESEVLWLALERPHSIAVLDDAAARRQAVECGVRVTGILGLLVDAKRQGLIPAVSPVLDDLERLGFHLSARTRTLILRHAGEAP